MTPQRRGSNPQPTLVNTLKLNSWLLLVYPAVLLAMIFRYWKISKLMKFMIQRLPKLFRGCYISEELIGLAFFDDNISEIQKSAMVFGLYRDKSSLRKWFSSLPNDIASTDFCDFVLSKTIMFFKILELPDEFPKLPTS